MAPGAFLRNSGKSSAPECFVDFMNTVRAQHVFTDLFNNICHMFIIDYRHATKLVLQFIIAPQRLCDLKGACHFFVDLLLNFQRCESQSTFQFDPLRDDILRISTMD